MTKEKIKKSSNKDKDMEDLKVRIEKLKTHLEKNKQDNRTKRTLLIKEAKLRKLKKYRERKNLKLS